MDLCDEKRNPLNPVNTAVLLILIVARFVCMPVFTAPFQIA